MFDATLVCWTCQKKQAVTMPAPPTFGFELIKAAQDVGWIGAMDTHRRRALIFCSDACDKAARTKDGFYRARPPKIHTGDPA